MNSAPEYRSVSQLGTQRIKTVIWIYFWLLLVEGALRKWVLPELSAPLLVIRDPIAIVAYYLALRHGIFYRNKPLFWIMAVAFVFMVVSFAQYFLLDSNLIVTAYGFRTNFLHLPLIILSAMVFSHEDAERVGYWTEWLCAPMALLMIMQFRSAPDDILNRTASGEGVQIAAALGKIRPAGTFSFITGVAQYLTLASAFALYHATETKNASRIRAAICGCSILSALAVSGSRLAIFSVMIVFAGFAVACLADSRLMQRAHKVVMAGVVIGAAVAMTDFFNEGMEVMNARVENASEVEGVTGGVSGRLLDTFTEPFFLMERAPFWGNGLGIGTNVGAMLISGKAEFLLSEGEWSRIVLESGAILGLLYLTMRIGLVIWIGTLAFTSARHGNALPILLFAAFAPNFVNGAFGQPTTLGFSVLGAGLCLAACRIPSKVAGAHAQ
jgi:hypothetical protein